MYEKERVIYRDPNIECEYFKENKNKNKRDDSELFLGRCTCLFVDKKITKGSIILTCEGCDIDTKRRSRKGKKLKHLIRRPR